MNRILVLTYWPYHDALIQGYALPCLYELERTGNNELFLLTLERSEAVKEYKVSEKITNLRRRYHPFGIRAMVSFLSTLRYLRKFIRQHHITHVHCWCTPAGMMGYMLTQHLPVTLVIDSFEPHAESMVESGTWSHRSLAYKLLFHYEKKMAARADALIAVASGMGGYANRTYHTQLPELPVKPSCVDLVHFSLRNRKNQVLLDQLGLKDRLVLCYAGKFGGIYLKEEVFHFFSRCCKHWGGRISFLLLTEHDEHELMRLAEKFRIPPEQLIIRYVSHRDIPEYMGLADFAICPVKPLPSKRYCTPVKNGEYWALGLPVIMPRNISDDSQIISDHDIGYLWDALSEEEFDKSIRYMDQLLSTYDHTQLYTRIRPVAEKYRNLSIARSVYAGIYK